MEQLIDHVFRLKTKCIAKENEIMKEFNLSPAEYNGIAAMTPREKICGNDVAAKMELSPSRASRVIERMVQNGYLVRKVDGKDRRKCTIYLAKKGSEVKKKIENIKNECEKKFHEQLSPEELEQFTGNLKKVMDIL